MSDIQAQARQDAEFDQLDMERWESTTEDMRDAYEMGKRHGAEGWPKWSTEPWCVGKWVNSGIVYDIQEHDLHSNLARCGTWYGPLPADEVKA
jgi:hypothetical protein